MDTKELCTILENTSLAELQETIKNYNSVDLQNVADLMEYVAQQLIRKASYIDSRVYGMQNHKTAVKEQNKKIAKVRRAMGFSYPKNDVNF
jgi:hypothetical protein